jgi:hypothetical protein
LVSPRNESIQGGSPGETASAIPKICFGGQPEEDLKI